MRYSHLGRVFIGAEKMTITTELAQRMREHAEKATPGEWVVQFNDEVYSTDGVENQQIAMAFSDNPQRDA